MAQTGRRRRRLSSSSASPVSDSLRLSLADDDEVVREAAQAALEGQASAAGKRVGRRLSLTVDMTDMHEARLNRKRVQLKVAGVQLLSNQIANGGGLDKPCLIPMCDALSLQIWVCRSSTRGAYGKYSNILT